MLLIPTSLRHRVLFAHVIFSVLLIVGLCFWVLVRWYPGGLLSLQGGVPILLSVAAISFVVGPLLTLKLFRPESKRTRELVLDMTLILVLQLGSFGYGVWTLSIQRPAYLVFLYDRFFVVSQQDVLGNVPAQAKAVQPWSNGPRPVFVKLSFGAEMEIGKTVYGLHDAPPMALLPSAYAQLSEGKAKFELIQQQQQQESKKANSAVQASLIYVPIIGRAARSQAVIDVDKAELLRIESDVFN